MKKNRIAILLLALSFATLAACGAPTAPEPEFETFSATVLEVHENSLLVLADEGTDVRRSSDQFSVGLGSAELLDENGSALSLDNLRWYDRVEITFNGAIDDTYPAQIAADKVKLLPKAKLTREDVKTLAQKGENLDWPDFAPYESIETGSGLYILVMELDEEYALWVGGNPREKPMYVRLRRTGTEEYISLTTQGELLDRFFAGEVATVEEEETEAAASSGDYPAAIQIEGKIYLVRDPFPAEIDDSAILGYTTSYTDGWPEEDGQTNFSRELGLPYAEVWGGMAVLFDNEWHFCDQAKVCKVE